CFGDTNSNQLNINMSDLQDKNWTQLRNLNSWNEPQYILGNTSTLYGGGILGHDSMNVDDPLVAVNGQAFAVAQGDSNFGIYDENGGMLRAWGTNGYYRTRMFMQTDGNLVLRDAFGTVLWAASWEVGNYMTAGSKVEMQTDGNLVVRRPNGTVFWASNTFS
ncbi:MAG: hypothetical protein ACRDYV_09920, partial [Acidimicrobiia bacterium]